LGRESWAENHRFSRLLSIEGKKKPGLGKGMIRAKFEGRLPGKGKSGKRKKTRRFAEGNEVGGLGMLGNRGGDSRLEGGAKKCIAKIERKEKRKTKKGGAELSREKWATRDGGRRFVRRHEKEGKKTGGGAGA